MNYIDGDCDSRFNNVKQVFSENFANGWECEGAAFAVYLNGERIIDLWGGYAECASKRYWKSDTITPIFSTTKALCAVCIALLVDRGHANYSDLVSKHWPEFASNGKEKITLEVLLAHKAGLAYTDIPMEESDIKDHHRIANIFENQSPIWSPGERVGYHMLTIGFIFDQLVRRIDPKKRSVSLFFKEEIAEPYGLDLYINSVPEIESRIARLSLSSLSCALREFREYPIVMKAAWDMFIGTYAKSFSSIFNRIGSEHHRILFKALGNFPFIQKGLLSFNNPDIRSLEIPSSNGIGSAKSLAKLFALIAAGDILKQTTMRQLIEPFAVEEFDIVLDLRISYGKGFIYSKNTQGQWMFGHSGMGGQNVKIDVHNKLAFAYVCNGLKYGCCDRTLTFMRLQCALYKCLEDHNLLDSKFLPFDSSEKGAANSST